MELLFEKPAAKALRAMTRKSARAMLARITEIADDPFGEHRNVTALKGVKDGFRLRQGDWRALYRLDRRRGAMIVENVKSRGGAYR